MSNDVNSVVLVGRLAADPEFRDVGSTQILKLRVAVNRDRKIGEKWESQGHFFDCDVLGARAGKLAGFLSKGSRVAVSGHLEQRRWEASDGSKRSAVSVFVTELQMVDSKPQTRDPDEARAERYEQESISDIPSDIPDNDGDGDDDSDIPFVWRPYAPREHTHNPFA